LTIDGVTSADVARASGVSQATVSYVLDNDPWQSNSAILTTFFPYAAEFRGISASDRYDIQHGTWNDDFALKVML
jgi:hypothetical protein